MKFKSIYYISILLLFLLINNGYSQLFWTTQNSGTNNSLTVPGFLMQTLVGVQEITVQSEKQQMQD